MSAHTINLLSLPNEVLFIITQHLTDPCDLLALRRSHSVFNNLLQNRFNSTFRNTPCTRRQNKKPTLDAILFWAAKHNHIRFAQKTLRLVEWGSVKLRDGQRNTLTDKGCLQASCEALRNGHCEMYVVILEASNTNNADNHTCFEVAVSEGNVEAAKVVMDNSLLNQWVTTHIRSDEGVTPLLLLMKNHEVELVEYWIELVAMFQRASCDTLLEYAYSLQDHEEGWCQKIVWIVMKIAYGGGESLESLPWPGDCLREPEWIFDLLRKVGKRECGSECWINEQNMGIEELEHELRLLQAL